MDLSTPKAGTAWPATRLDRSHRGRCGLCGAAADTNCGDNDFNHTGRTWRIGLTCRGGGVDTTLVGLTGTCQATTESTYLWDWDTPGSSGDLAHRKAILYRGACVGCGWAGPVQRDENTAVEDAHDHTLPSWRDLPVVTRHHHDANDKQRAAWSAEIARLYDAYGFPSQYAPGNGGVIRTMRQPFGTRSHLAHNYYDICAGVEAQQRRADAAQAPTLF